MLREAEEETSEAIRKLGIVRETLGLDGASLG